MYLFSNYKWYIFVSYAVWYVKNSIRIVVALFLVKLFVFQSTYWLLQCVSGESFYLQ